MQKVIFACPVIISFFGMHGYFLNQGATGLSLPMNIFSWATMALFILIITLNFKAKKIIFSTIALPMFIVGVAVLTVPLLYADPAAAPRAAWRLAGLFAGLVFYFTWLQLRLRRDQRQVLWLILLLAACGQAVLALVQLFFPEFAWVPVKGNRPYGIFQQPNILASFTATGLALALMLFLLPGFILRKAWHEHCRQAFLVFALLVMPALLVWTQSRVGWLGGALVAVLFLLRFKNASPLACKRAAMLIVIGVVTGVATMLLSTAESNLEYIAHDASNHARWTMLRDTLRMIDERPFSGWGYGGFEYQFLHYRINQVPPTLVTEIASHPHNELLLWWVEGGVVALVGMGLLISGGLRLAVRAWQMDRREVAAGGNQAGEQVALCLLLLPMALHTQLEHPFYLSALHFMIFLIILGTLECQVSDAAERKPLPRFAGLTLQYLLPMAAAATLVLMFFTLQGGLTLTRAERNGLINVKEVRAMPALSRWIHQERVDFDQQVNALLTYNKTQNEALLTGYARWAQDYLTRRIDANVYASLISILHYQQQYPLAEHYRREAALLFPDDVLFNVEIRRSTESVGDTQ